MTDGHLTGHHRPDAGLDSTSTSTSTSTDPATPADHGPLRPAAWALLAGYIVHNADHARRGLDVVADGVVWAGTLAMTIAAVAVTLVFVGHRLAPAFATAVGFSVALGVSAVHLTPEWGPLSDSLITGSVDTITVVAVLAEVVAALWFGVVGLRIMSAQNFQIIAIGKDLAR